MYVCLCHGITDRQIRAAVDEGASSLRQLRKRMPVGRGCGRCVEAAREVISEQVAEHRCLQHAVGAASRG